MRAYVQGVSYEGSISTQTLFANVDLGEKLKVALLNGDEVFANDLKTELGRRNLRAALNAGGVTLTLIDEAKIETHTVGEMIAARSAARKAKNFKEADRIRDELSAMGIQLKDSKDPATGEIVTTWEVRAFGTTEVKR
jgi:cysteinyl-tRNA synthetase